MPRLNYAKSRKFLDCLPDADPANSQLNPQLILRRQLLPLAPRVVFYLCQQLIIYLIGNFLLFKDFHRFEGCHNLGVLSYVYR